MKTIEELIDFMEFMEKIVGDCYQNYPVSSDITTILKKEKERREGCKWKDTNDKIVKIECCPILHTMYNTSFKYCPNCGRPIIWM